MRFVSVLVNLCFISCVGHILPKRLLQICESINDEMKESIRTGRLGTMAPENFAKLPTSLFLLIPVSTKFDTICWHCLDATDFEVVTLSNGSIEFA
jgi:hypothetical protein